MRRVDLVGVGYTAFEAVGGCYWVRRERALVGAKNPKLSCRCLVLANDMQGDCFLGGGHPVGVGYARLRHGGCDWVSRKGGPVEVKKKKTELPGLGFGKQNVEGLFFV